MYFCLFSLILGRGPENAYSNTKLSFLGELETEILKDVYSGGNFGKWPNFAYLWLSFL